ncbi:DNA translocase FtsK [Litchfieldella anticariensis]|uniref:DNA translocase FtsK n=1 Tax=Litchfieldella anticariensis TaxID=258591 RepID=UPI00068528E5|nr:DNA translocase FtsK [Halomonas anticariensis]
MSVKKKTTGRRVSAAQAKEQAKRFGLRLQGASREGVVILLLAGCVFLLLAMFSYQPGDPGWSHSGPETRVDNWMGPIGAWLADVLYSLFGASALWWPGMLGFAAWRLVRSRQVHFEWDATALAVRSGGLLLLLLGTTTVSALHFYNPASILPYKSGGILGEGLVASLQPLVGAHGTTLLALVALLCGFPLFSGLSWLSVMDEVGHRSNRLLSWVWGQLGGWRESREDHEEATPLPSYGTDEATDDESDKPRWWQRLMPWRRREAASLDLAEDIVGSSERRYEPRLEADGGTDIPWDVPARTPSAKAHPEAAYDRQQKVERLERQVRQPASTAPAPQPGSRRVPETIPDPVLPDDDEPALAGISLRADRDDGVTSSAKASAERIPEGEAAPADDSETVQEEPAPVAWASSGSSPHSPARSGKREPSLVSWNDADWEDEADDEPRVTWSQAGGDPTASSAEASDEVTVSQPLERVDEDGPRRATAEQGRAAADEPEGPTLWTVEHLQSQRPLFDDLPDPDGELPSLRLLTPAETHQPNYTPEQLSSMAELLETRLREYGVKAEVVETWPGPVITRFEIKPAAGVKVSKISNLAKDLARSLMVKSVRVVEIIPGKPTVGIEIPNPQRAMIRLREVIDSDRYQQADSALTLALGQDIGGAPVVANLGKMPHLLVAGTTGSGKSVGVNAMLISMLLKATPDEVRMIMVDPKMLELSVYDGIPHLLAPVVTDMKEAANGLRWCVAEMERRYKLMAAMGVRNIAGFNGKLDEAERAGAQVADPLWEPQPWEMHEPPPVLEKLPYIVVVIDEFADMFMIVGKKVEELIARLAQKARAAGIHLILATQRPSVDVVTGLIKANIPTRMAFQVSSRVDSRTILDQGGAENLLGHGDMLYLPAGAGLPMRVHGAFVDDDEVHRVVEDWKRRGEPEYIDEILSGGVSAEALTGLEAEGGGEGDDAEQDALYDEAVMFVTESRRASISAVQRRFKIGYNRAARLVESMESAGVVSSMGSNGSREVLAPPPVGD